MKRCKVLFTATIAKHILRFHIPYLKWFKENGYEVHVAVNGDESIPYCDVKHLISFVRTPYSMAHFRALKELKTVIDREDYLLIHCHTPMGSVITRLAARKARTKGTKIIYTAHGFHFFKGSSVFNWITYYPMEVILSYLTDAIITINKQDYDIIQSPFSSADKFLIHGMGVDEARFRPFRAEERSTVRILNGYTDEDFILIYVGEFIERKNHEFIIQTVPSLKRLIPGIKVLFAGRGVLLEKMKLLAHELGIADEINFLSFRDDVNVWMALSDIGISSSKQEGLGLNLAEEMLCELPIIATKDRGHQELIEHGRNGYLFDQNNKEQFVDCVFKLYRDKELRTKFALNSAAKGLSFTLSRSIKSMTEIYGRYLKD